MIPGNARNTRAKGSVRSAERVRHHDRLDRQFARFLLVGACNTALSFVAYRLLLLLGTPYVIAAALGFSVGALNGYVLNRRWTFAARDSARTRVVYVAVQAVGAASTSLLVLLFVDVVGVDKVGAYLAAIPPVTVTTFIANRLWTFAERT
jgi:putative flippase GtrA